MRPLVIIIIGGEEKWMVKLNTHLRKVRKKVKEILKLVFLKDFLIVLIFPSLVVLLTNETFLNFVVEIVKLILNRSFYYLCNNRIFVFKEVNYESG